MARRFATPALAGRQVRAVRLAFLLAAAVLADAPAAAGGPIPAGNQGSGRPGFIDVRAQEMVNADGRRFAPRCINLGHWLVPEGYILGFHQADKPREIFHFTEHALGADGAQAFWRSFRDAYIGEADIRLIANLGFNTIRVPFHYGLFAGPGLRPALEGPGYALLDRLIGWSRQAGLRVILDMHAAPGGQTGANHDDSSGYALLFYVPAYQETTVRIWRALAERYRNEPTVLGYDLLNEPIAHFQDYNRLTPRLETLYRRIVAAIREVDRQHLIFLAGPEWSTSFAAFGPPFAERLVYTYHKFWAAPVQREVQEYVTFRARHDVPIFLGESGEASEDWIAAWRGLHDRQQIGWCFWTYKNLDSRATVVSVTRPAGWEAVIDTAERTARPGDGAEAAEGADPAAVRRALHEYLVNILLEKGTLRPDYVAALGLARPAEGAIAAAVNGSGAPSADR